MKRFGRVTALEGIDFDVEQGSVLGLLGPNGAGKTTVIRILATLVRQDAGSARICGLDVRAEAHRVRQVIGLTGQSATVDEDLTGRENLLMVGRLLGLPRRQARHRADELLSESGLLEAGGRPAKTYSGGMRRRLDLAVGLVHRPAVVFLDEPTTGLDPARRAETWAMVRALATQGATVVLTTQYLEEADHLADDIVVVDAGRVAARGTPDELKRRLGRQTLEVRITDLDRLGDAVEHVERVLQSRPVVDAQTGRLSAAVADGRTMPSLVASLAQDDIGVSELTLRLPTLDDVFLDLTGNPGAQVSGEPAAGRRP